MQKKKGNILHSHLKARRMPLMLNLQYSQMGIRSYSFLGTDMYHCNMKYNF